MATFQELKAKMQAVADAIANLDLKVDEIRTFIESLKANQPVTQAQLDEAFGILDAIETHTKAVHDETDALDA